MPKEFVTYFDTNYAARGLVMLESLSQWGDVHATVLCLDDDIATIITSELGQRVRTVSMEEVWNHEPALRPLKNSRAPWEFYATHKPVVIDWALRQLSADSLIAFIDADTFFFSDPAPLFAEAEGSSVVISPHRFNPATQYLSICGLYNAGFGLWRHDSWGLRCLYDWRRDCLESCFAKVDEFGRFMNQTYLNHWPVRYANVHILTHPGANLAPWNVATHTLSGTSTGVLVDSQSLVFYHFHYLSRNADGAWQTYDLGRAMKQPLLHKLVYAPYLRALEAMTQRLQSRYGVTGIGSVRPPAGNFPLITFKL